METDRRKEHLENGKVQDSQTELEDALYLTGSGKFHTFLLLSCGIGLAGVMMETFGTSFLLPSAQCDFNLTSTDKSLLNGLYPVGMICGSHLWGYLADTRGRKKILICAFLLDAACAILSSFSHALWLFLIFRFLCGFLIVAASSVIYAYFGEFHSPETRNKGLMWLSIFIGLGIGLQPGIAWLIIPQNWEWHLPWLIYKPWRLFIVACAVPNLVSGLILIFWLPETPKFLMSLGKKEEALKVLKNMYARNSGNSGEKYPVKSVILIEDGATQIPMSASGSPIINLIVHMWNQTAPLFKPPFLWKTLLACFVQYGLYASANGLSLWLPDIFNHEAAYYASYPDSHPSICQIFTPNQLLMHSENITQSNDNFSLDFNQITSMNLHQNDTLTFNCENNTLVLSVNNSTEIMINPITNILKCQNDTIVNNLTDKSLQFDFQDGKVILTFLNVSVANHELQNDTKSSASEQLKHNDMECNSDVDLSAFQNTLIIGLASCIAYTCVGFLIGPLGKKTIIVCSLLSGGVAGLLLDYVNANWEFFAMALAFVTLSGMCITVMVSAVVEIFPTNLRAMAVCLSLMTGRMGSFTAHMLMGVLLENHCVVMTYILGGLCTCCGLLAFLLPSPKKND